MGDAAGAVRRLRAQPTSNGKAGTIGYCAGGRQAFLTALELDIQGAVDCYGSFVVGAPPDGHALQVQPLAGRVAELRAPVLGLFGNRDIYPSADEIDELEKLMQTQARSTCFPSTCRSTARRPRSTDGSAWKPSSPRTCPGRTEPAMRT